MRTELDRRAMATLSSGHLFVDFASGTIPALIPFITQKFELSYAQAALLMLVATASSSLLQPFFGLWSDRRGALWLIPGGVALAGIGVGLAAVAPTYLLVLVLILAAGVGIAAFHPEGAKFALYASGLRRASGMAYFSIGGNAGFALGAVVVTPLVVWLGLAGGLVAALPVLAGALLLARQLGSFRLLEPLEGPRAEPAGEDRLGAIVLLSIVVVLRSVVWVALLTFVPLWLISQGSSEAGGNHMLSLLLLAGAVGTLALAPVADRFGLRRTLLVTQILLAPLILVFVYVGGIAGAVALMLLGICIVGTFSVTMVLGQLYLPRHIGMASGLAGGMPMGIAGFAVVALGVIADAVDLKAALTVCALAPAVGVLFCLLLPAPAPARVLAAEPATT